MRNNGAVVRPAESARTRRGCRCHASADHDASFPIHLALRRPMPSEGLSLDQMCQAVHSLGYAPNLYRADTFDVSRGLLYSAVSSGISPVLIIEQGDRSHAVAVAGMKVRRPHVECLVDPLMDDRAGDLAALYVHDDRYGPYLKAEIRRRRNRLLLQIKLRNPRSWKRGC